MACNSKSKAGLSCTNTGPCNGQHGAFYKEHYIAWADVGIIPVIYDSAMQRRETSQRQNETYEERAFRERLGRF